VVIYCDVAYVTESDTYLRRVTEIGVVLPQLVSSGTGRVAVTPVFKRTSVRAELELVGTELPDRLAEECNRVLTTRHLEIEAVLKGAEVRW
jgi:hypothetical protein